MKRLLTSKLSLLIMMGGLIALAIYLIINMFYWAYGSVIDTVNNMN